MEPFIYILPAALSVKKIAKNLPALPPYRGSIEKGEKLEGQLLDTFEDEVFLSGKMLFQLGEMLILADLQSGRVDQQKASEGWSFAGDLEDGAIASLLQNISPLRSFLAVARVKVRPESGLLLDDEGKTRTRFHNLSISVGKKTVSVGSTHYLRGYRKAHADLQRALKKIGARACLDVGQVYNFLGIKREEYSAKPQINLNPEAPATDSATKIIRSFIRVARLNEKGIVADHDTEFLHDYRVSFRKVRSVLSLFKGVYSPRETTRLKEQFAELMQKTNRLRDLDVYLLNRQNYFKLVPPDTHDGLEILFDYFAGERRKEYRQVRKVMNSKSYLRQVGTLEKLFTSNSTLASGPRGEEKSLAFACRLVLQRYNKVCKIARKIDGKTEDAIVHELRINCKKLRYLMEFFSPLFPNSDIKSLIKGLKLLQDNLGNFNDYSVQQLFLRKLLSDQMTVFKGHELKVAESVGALTAMLNRLQKKERGLVMKNFGRFDSTETRTAFTKLFKTEDSVHENNSLL